jgi:hypothetical protein
MAVSRQRRRIIASVTQLADPTSVAESYGIRQSR